MNNWDTRPSISVVLGTEEVPEKMVLELAGIEAPVGYTPMPIETPDNKYVVCHATSANKDAIRQALECLDDHIANTDKGDWLDYAGMYSFGSRDIHCSTGTYYGQGISIHVYYLHTDE